MRIHVLIVDDHAVVRDGLQALLEMHPEICVIGHAANGRAALELIKELRPEIVLMDLSMPGMNGVDCARIILEQDPQIGVIMLSMLGTAEHIYRALQAGVRGYLLKESAGREVVDAVLKVAEGQRYFSQSVTEMFVSDYLDNRKQVMNASPLESLSLREQEVMYLVLDGKSSTEIGEMLHLSSKTVDSYRSRLMQKLGVTDLVGLVKFAYIHGLITVN
jgi:DNA-binding NarL/FixJ family response regulator